MMILDLLDVGNYASYNITVAKLLGLNISIYLSEIMRVSKKATDKKKLTNDYFSLDRNYILDRTTFSSAVQKEMDETLCSLGLIEKAESDKIKFNVTALTSLFMSDDEELIKSVEKWAKIKARANKTTKTQGVANSLKEYIVCDNAELQEAYEGWIDGVYANPNGFLSKKSIQIFQKMIDSYCNHDLDLALNIITIATINGYRDATWAINTWEKDKSFNYRLYSYSSKLGQQSIKVSDEVF